MTCAICERDTCDDGPMRHVDCYRVGYEREKARAEIAERERDEARKTLAEMARHEVSCAEALFGSALAKAQEALAAAESALVEERAKLDALQAANIRLNGALVEARRKALEEAVVAAEDEEECGLEGSCAACRIAARLRALASEDTPGAPQPLLSGEGIYESEAAAVGMPEPPAASPRATWTCVCGHLRWMHGFTGRGPCEDSECMGNVRCDGFNSYGE